MKVRHKKSTLIFIDTNIYLDFYRNREKDYESSMIQHIDCNHEKIITTDQVFMEYKKNRQKVIIDALKSLGASSINIKPPAFLSEAKPIEMINDAKKLLENQSTILKKRILDVLKNPITKDKLYQCLQRLFKDGCKYHLGRTNKLRFDIRRLARKRFCLGYPPKKNNDTSMGDAINWEWIVHCAKESKNNIVIVSRDTDYGEIYDNQPFLNDWLSQEFKERISQQRKISLTNKLSQAFKMANVEISKEEEEQENEFIKEKENQELL